MEPFANFPEATQIVFKLGIFVAVASVCPHARAFHKAFLTFLKAGVKVDDHRSIFTREHDVIGRNIVMNDAEAMEVLNAFADILKTPLDIERSSVMIDSIDQVLIVPGEAKSCNATSSDDATVISSDVRMWMLHKRLADSSFSKHAFA